MNLEDVRNIVSLIADANGISVNLHPDDFSDLLNISQLKYFKQKWGLPEEYQPGMPLPRQSYEITSRLTEDLRPFKKVLSPTTMNVDGQLSYPSDYFIVTSITYSYIDTVVYLRKVEILNDEQYGEAITKVSTKPDEWYPVCNPQATYIQFNPIMTGNLSMTYLRLPVKPVYAVKITDGFYEYDSVNSVELEWGDMQIIDIIAILLGDLGMPLKSADVINYAENLKAKGV